MMALNVIKPHIYKAVATRSYCEAQSACHAISRIKKCKLPNRLIVAAAESNSPILRISVAIRAGSRYEVPATRGVTHMIRIAAGLSTKNSSNFAIIRNIQQAGATLTCATSREVIAYTLVGTGDAMEYTTNFLSDVVSCQVFKPWEISDSIPRLKLELASVPSPIKVVDLLHVAAYRTGLGNSIFCPQYRADKMSSKLLSKYYCDNFTSGRTAVFGIGICLDKLEKFAETICLECGTEDLCKSKYHGGEIRFPKGGDLAYVALATESASRCNVTENIAFSILQLIFGTSPQIKYGKGAYGLFSKVFGSKDIAVSALSVSYSDTGLFGAVIVAPGDKIKNIVIKTVKTLQSANIVKRDVERAKKQLIVRGFLAGEHKTNFAVSSAILTATIGDVKTPQDYGACVNCVTFDDVQAALNKVIEGNLSIASVGKISHVPFLDELQ